MKNPEPTQEILSVKKLLKAAYQRDTRGVQVKEMVANFKPELLNSIVVSLRDDKYWIMDGAHRVQCCIFKEYEYVKCIVHRGLTYEEEALMFKELNSNLRKVSAGEIMRTEVEAKLPDALEIQKILQSHGFELSYTNASSGNKIGSVGALKTIFSTMGPAHLYKVLGVIRKSWNGNSKALESFILLGMALFLKDYEYNESILIKKMFKIDPVVILREGKADISTSKPDRFARVINKHYVARGKRS